MYVIPLTYLNRITYITYITQVYKYFSNFPEPSIRRLICVKYFPEAELALELV